jgi:hypothetical protein
MKSQLLISHHLLLIKHIAAQSRRKKNQAILGKYPPLFVDIPSSFVSMP